MKNKDLFLEDNGHYWISVYGDEPEIGKYVKSLRAFSTPGCGIYNENQCKVLSNIILRDITYGK